jgi:hypothetical protein
LDTSEEICEALVRHLEAIGSDSLEKNFIQGDRITCSVWCVIGQDAEAFAEMARKWMDENGYKVD